MRDKRISFNEQPANWVIEIPSPDKYEKVQFDVIRERKHAIKIHTTHLPRFKPIEKKNEPSPTSYNYDDAVEKT